MPDPLKEAFALRNASEIQDWMVAYIAELLGKAESEISRDMSFDRLGLDSSSAVALVGDLEDWLGSAVDPTLPYDFPTIELLASQIALESVA